MRVAALCAALIGCAYSPGSLHTRAGETVQTGCIDLAIERRPDLPGQSVLAYTFGNRCDHPAVVDLARVAAVGRTVDGREVNLAAFDPHHELRAVELDGRASGNEAIAYPSTIPLAEVCVDAAAIAHESPARWVCFARNAHELASKEMP